MNYAFIFLVFIVFIIFAINLPYIYFTGVTFSSIIMLSVLYVLFDRMFKIKIPFGILFLLFVGVLIDALGNFFDLYGKKIWFFWYDEMSHFVGTGIIAFAMWWLFHHLSDTRRLIVPRNLIFLLVFSLSVTLAAFYEVTELWDEWLSDRKRIWGEYDTARDLQWDMIGGGIGIILGHLILRKKAK